MKRLFLYVIALLTLLGIVISAGRGNNTFALLPRYAEEIAATAESEELAAVEWARSQSGSWTATRTVPLEISARHNTIFVYNADSLVFWSNNKNAIPPEEIKNLQQKDGRSLLHLSAGWFVYYQERTPPLTLAVLTPLRYFLETDQSGPFPANTAIPVSVQITESATDTPLIMGGKPIAYLKGDGLIQAPSLLWLQLGAALLFVFLLMSLAWRGALRLGDRFGKPAGIGAVSLTTLVLLWGVRWLAPGLFGALPLYDPPFAQAGLLADSPGTWLFSVCILAWAATFFQCYFSDTALRLTSESAKQMTAALLYALVMASVIGAGLSLDHLVTSSRVDFNFDNLTVNSPGAILCIAGAMVLLWAVFQFGHRLTAFAGSLALSSTQRLVALGVAAVPAAALSFLGDSSTAPWLQWAFALAFAAGLDFFSRWKKPGFGWTWSWLMFMSLFAAVSLYRAYVFKDRSLRKTYAEALTVARDEKGAEKYLPDVLRSFERDTQQLGYLLKPWPFKAEEAELRRFFNARIFRYNYLFQHYRLNVYAFDRENLPLLINQNQTFEEAVRQNWEKGTAVADAPGVRSVTSSDGVFRYMIRLGTRRMGDPGDPAEVYCFLDHTYPKPTRVYARLFYNTPYKDLHDLWRYDFAVQRQERRTVEQGIVPASVLAAVSGNGDQKEVPEEQRLYAVRKADDGQSIAAVGRAESSLFKPLFLFAVLFTLCSIFVLLLVLVNSRFGFLPADWSELMTLRGSLAKRIHYGIMAVASAAFLLIGLLSYHNFTAAARQTEQADLDFRAEAVLAHLKTKATTGISADSLRRVLSASAQEIADNLSIDVNLYNRTGDMIFSTREDLRQLGILPLKMHPEAYRKLGTERAGVTLPVVEEVGGVAFSNQYLPIYNSANQLTAFLGTPSDLKNRTPGVEVSDFIGALAALYVFFLLIAYVITLYLTRSIIRPVVQISKHIAQLDFEQKEHEHIQYSGDSNDELSGLVTRYNEMTDKLESSKGRIVKLEREGAWKEMARQVAHDIKNPLTTMKLSMQQLERVSNNPEQAAAYLRKAITRLIEQIDSLAQIASEFSLFANMDIKHKQEVNLNNVVESVYDLFSEQGTVTLELDTPADQFQIMGDKNHLIRVFNNLIINAIQAIPSDRQGHIRVRLGRVDNMAVVLLGDNGGGIPPEIRNRVFEPNFTTKTSGSGLGLAICKKIIEAHDGDIRFETRDNEGTDFFVELPIVRIEKEGIARLEKAMTPS